MHRSHNSLEGRSPKRLRLEWVGTLLEPVRYCDRHENDNYSLHSLSSDFSEATPEPFDGDITDILPDDLLAKIFFGGYLNTLEVIRKVSCLSHKVRRLAQSTVKLLDLRACTPALKVGDLAKLIGRFNNISELDFSYCQEFDKFYFNELTPLSPTLRILRLRGALSLVLFPEFGINLQRGTQVLAQLVELDVSAINRDGSTAMESTDLDTICSACQNLERLNLAWRKTFTDASVLTYMKRLKVLDVSLTSITSEGCKHLAKLSLLEELDLSATDIGNDGILNLIPKDKSSNIQILRIRFVRDLTQQTLLYLEENAPNLRLLDITSSGLHRENSIVAFRLLKLRGVTVLV